MNNKTKAALCGAAIVGVVGIAGAIAYLTATDTATNTFTVGKVSIDLTEPAWDALPDADHDGIPDIAENMTPRQQIAKNPMVTNNGNNSAYVYLKVTVPAANVTTAKDNGEKNAKADTQLFTLNGLDTTNWQLIEAQKRNPATGDIQSYEYVYGYKTALAAGATTATPLFTSVTFANIIEGEGLEETTKQIQIEAFGIQSDNISSTVEGATDLERGYKIIVNQQ